MAIKIIAPGKGSSAVYPEAILEQAARDKVFPKGLQMYWNHQTESEQRERPEGDLRDLAGVLTENAYYDRSGPAGPGLYARAKATEAYAKPIDDLSKHIGVSIRAFGASKPGKDLPIVEKLTRAASVDFVTRAGAGGKILQLFEAARPHIKPKESEDMDKLEVQGLITEAMKPLQDTITGLQAENKVLRESAAALIAKDAITEAARFVRGKLADPSVVLHGSVQARLTRDLAARAPMTEAGALDTEKFTPIVEQAIKESVAEFAAITGSGRVAGMGSATPVQVTAETIKESESGLRAIYERRYAALNLKDEALKRAVDAAITGRVN
jgi:hypothetical protein